MLLSLEIHPTWRGRLKRPVQVRLLANTPVQVHLFKYTLGLTLFAATSLSALVVAGAVVSVGVLFLPQDTRGTHPLVLQPALVVARAG